MYTPLSAFIDQSAWTEYDVPAKAENSWLTLPRRKNRSARGVPCYAQVYSEDYLTTTPEKLAFTLTTHSIKSGEGLTSAPLTQLEQIDYRVSRPRLPTLERLQQLELKRLRDYRAWVARQEAAFVARELNRLRAFNERRRLAIRDLTRKVGYGAKGARSALKRWLGRVFTPKQFVPKTYRPKYFDFASGKCIAPCFSGKFGKLFLPCVHSRVGHGHAVMSYQSRYYMLGRMRDALDFTITMPVTASRFVPALDSSKVGRAIARAMPQVREVVDLPLFLAEIKDLPKLVTQIGGLVTAIPKYSAGLVKALKSLRGGSSLATVSSKAMNRAISDFSCADLARKFGFEQAVKDFLGIADGVFNTLEKLQKFIRNRNRILSKSVVIDRETVTTSTLAGMPRDREVQDGSVVSNIPPDRLPSAITNRINGVMDVLSKKRPTLDETTTWTQRLCLQYGYDFTDQFGRSLGDTEALWRAFLDSFGIYVNPALLWELIPFSFVFDWFIRIGPSLKRMALKNLVVESHVLQACISTTVDVRTVARDVSVTESENKPGDYYWRTASREIRNLSAGYFHYFSRELINVSDYAQTDSRLFRSPRPWELLTGAELLLSK